jgi:hypothetical protein
VTPRVDPRTPARCDSVDKNKTRRFTLPTRHPITAGETLVVIVAYRHNRSGDPDARLPAVMKSVRLPQGDADDAGDAGDDGEPSPFPFRTVARKLRFQKTDGDEGKENGGKDGEGAA